VSLLDVVYNHAGYDTRYLRDPKTRKWLRSTIVGDVERTTSPAA